ncbi:MAG: NusG domain II-containing protein [Clostridiales bacterium]|nr:NusG domain II-containing protein [Clostridiales bacterium]
MKKAVIILAAVIFVLALAVIFRPKGGTIALVRRGNEVIRKIDLDKVSEPYEFTVKSEKGMNVIRVEKGRICVIEADCPDKICQKRGYISGGSLPIVCLPHELSVSIEGNEEPDAATGGM